MVWSTQSYHSDGALTMKNLYNSPLDFFIMIYRLSGVRKNCQGYLLKYFIVLSVGV